MPVPRVELTKLHQFEDPLHIAYRALLCGAELIALDAARSSADFSRR